MKAGWRATRLGEVLIERHETPSVDALASGHIPIVSKISFATGQIELRTEAKTNTGMILAHPGDLLISGINASKGAIAVYGSDKTCAVAATIHYSAYAPKQDYVDIKYLWWFLRSNFFQELLQEYVPGGIKTELKAKRFLPIPIPLPPLPEQRRIVARIEELAAQINEARELRRQVDVAIDDYFSSIQSLITYSEIAKITSIEELIDKNGLRNGKSIKSYDHNSEIKCLTLSSMRNGKINIANSKFVPMSRSEANSFLARNGDVYIIRGNGTKNLCGRAGTIIENIDGVIFPDLFIQVNLQKKFILPKFFVAIWNSTAIRSMIEEKAKTTSGIWKINQKHIFSTRIPVPPLTEQRRIVAELDALQTEVDTLKRHQAESAAALDALLPAVLDRAFKGEL